MFIDKNRRPTTVVRYAAGIGSGSIKIDIQSGELLDVFDSNILEGN
jgi:hypothetical protein